MPGTVARPRYREVMHLRPTNRIARATVRWLTAVAAVIALLGASNLVGGQPADVAWIGAAKAGVTIGVLVGCMLGVMACVGRWRSRRLRARAGQADVPGETTSPLA